MPDPDARTQPREMVYQGNGQWKEQSTSVANKEAILEEKTQENLAALSSNGSGKSGSSGSAGNSTSKKSTSEGKATKDFVEKEFFTLEGEVGLIATKKTIKIKAGTTVSINGVGKYLTGQYFVNTVQRTIDNSVGYAHSLSVIKNGFADGLKKGSPTEKAQEKEQQKVEHQEVNRPEEVKKEVPEQKYTMVKGDTLWAIAVKFYGDGSQYTKIAEANGISEKDFTRLPIGKELIVP